ncbi:peptidase S8/S53 domain-containing protein [Fusarium venenatum]|uniref:peptidase S8/S53 domain-containing protein n=1 Tax=Fusarium venenatum TaxID=56646 RepID=UPI001D26B9A8|nr:peptidase S8/S53 domain-containing protein [Fusarium venenatum]
MDKLQSSVESKCAISQAEDMTRDFDAPAHNVLGAASQLFPLIRRPTIFLKGLTVEELIIDNDQQSNATIDSRVICPNARIYGTSKKIRTNVKFRCCCDDAPHKSYLDYRDRSPVQRLANDIGEAYLTHQEYYASKPDTEPELGRFEGFQTDWGFPSTKVNAVTNQTRISHEENPLGRLFVTLANVFLVVGDRRAGEREACNVYFSFDERTVCRQDAERLWNYADVKRDFPVSDVDGNPAKNNDFRRICFDFKSRSPHVERLDLLQSRIWVLDYDANGKPYSSETDWETLTGLRVVESFERATFVKGSVCANVCHDIPGQKIDGLLPQKKLAVLNSGHERTANDWLDDLEKLFGVMKRDKKDQYEKVKIAIIDLGINDTVKGRYMAENNMYEEAQLFIARVFEKDHANNEEGPIRMAKAIDWAISNCVDIISISAGFRDYSKELDEAVTRAKAAGTLVVAAAANWSNTGTVAFPARHNLTTMCIYSTNMGNQSSNFNPEPRSDTSNFAVLGEGFQHPDQKRNEQMSGTSMATAAAVGLAANIIDFSRQEDNKSYICRSQDVGKLAGMLSIFSSISRPAGPLRYVAPLDLLPANHGTNQERGRQRVREILSLAMERAN